MAVSVMTVLPRPKIHTLLRDLTGHHLHIRLSSKQRKYRRRDFHIVNTAIAVGEQCPGHSAIAVVHGTDHVGLLPVCKPGVDVLCQQIRLQLPHLVIVFGGDAQRRTDLPMEQVGGSEYLLCPGIGVDDFKRGAVRP